jgi:hypothetical protein
MFDDLRPKGSAFDDDEPADEQEIAPVPEPTKAAPRRRRSSGETEIRILGLTAVQRLILAIMLFLNVTVLGCFMLIAFQAVDLSRIPFLGF